MPDPVPAPSPPGPPLVSVLVPLQRHLPQRRFVAECLRSLRMQTYPNLEIIVLDDGARDGSGEAALESADGDPRITVLKATRSRGPLATLRELMTQAAGEYLRYLHPFDRLGPTAVEKAVLALSSDQRIALVTSARVPIDEEGHFLAQTKEMAPLSPTDAILGGRALGDLALKMGMNVVGELSAVTFRRSSVDPDTAFSIGGRFFHAISAMALILRLLATGPAVYFAEPLVEIRSTADSTGTGDGRLRTMLEWIELVAASQKLAYLQDPLQEGHALSVLSGWLFEACMNGQDIAKDGVPGAFVAYGRALDHHLERRTSARLSVIISPHLRVPGELLDGTAVGSGHRIEVISVEEEGRPPVFAPTRISHAVGVVEVPAGSSHRAAWNAGAEEATGPYLALVARSAVLQPHAFSSAVRILDEHPLMGAVCCDAGPDLCASGPEALVVRSSAWQEVGGLPEEGFISEPGATLGALCGEIAAQGYETCALDAHTGKFISGPDAAGSSHIPSTTATAHTGKPASGPVAAEGTAC